MKFSEDIKKFILNTPWTFAKTYAATWPHEYLCSKYIDDTDLFYKLVRHIRKNAFEGRFYRRPVWYFEEDGCTYWTMALKADGEWNYPPEKEEIINRCRNDQTYEYRKEHGTLPGGG
jgi:hypothetical protein